MAGNGPARDDKNAPITVARGPVPREASARSLHGEGQALALRYNEGFFIIVARGLVPRARCMARKTRARAMARDRPSPYGVREGFFDDRRAGACPPRGLRARMMARDKPSPYGPGEAFLLSHPKSPPLDKFVGIRYPINSSRSKRERRVANLFFKRRGYASF